MCYADRTLQRGVPTLAHSASHNDEIHYEYNREHVSKPAALMSATSESFHNRVADESKCQGVCN